MVDEIWHVPLQFSSTCIVKMNRLSSGVQNTLLYSKVLKYVCYMGIRVSRSVGWVGGVVLAATVMRHFELRAESS